MDTTSGFSATTGEETLDPCDWTDVQVLSHRIVDDAVAYLRDVRERPVWREMPGDVTDFFTAPLPQSPTPLAEVYGDVVDKVMPYPMGNIHPRFWSWYMGSSNFTGALGDFLAAIQGSNLGGGNHAAALMDSQVVDWCKQMLGLPASASGTLVSGGSMATMTAHVHAALHVPGDGERCHRPAKRPAAVRVLHVVRSARLRAQGD